ncbi:MAG: NAD-dependent malic enzyme [Gammaproteobacteria bacterium]|nr:NAD-dependent malic enzyme [Gammaproteobacteria bacterium]
MNKNACGFDILNNPKLNKGTAFTETERDLYKLRGLLPAGVSSQESQIKRVLANLAAKTSDIERYIFLFSLQGRNERLYYRVIMEHIQQLMPVIYTPTVGLACQQFGGIFRETRGFYITPKDRGKMRDILSNWPEKDIRMIVITDGQRILGLGDLGANGMGIPIGKLALYVAGAGIPPEQCLPVMLDVGTNNEALLNDPLYLGVKQPRLTGAEYFELVDEFVSTVQETFPKALIQFEDFLTPNAYALLNTYRDQVLCFNDDIQGTAAMVLSGIYASTRISGLNFSDLRIMFLGAGSAAAGMADLIHPALCEAGMDSDEAYARLWFVDHLGLVVNSRDELPEHIVNYARDEPAMAFLDAVKTFKPHILIGATGVGGTFSEDVLQVMASNNQHPAIFALSNPSSHAECTSEQAYNWTDGKAIFASGSPSPAVEYNGRTLQPGQGNNAYIFPGLGLGALACEASRVTEEMFLVAAKTLASMVDQQSLDQGTIYPPLKNIRAISLRIACAVAEKAYQQNLAQRERPADLEQTIADLMFDPVY